jgi:hypothetical protein
MQAIDNDTGKNWIFRRRIAKTGKDNAPGFQTGRKGFVGTEKNREIREVAQGELRG